MSLKVEGITKLFGDARAVDNVSFEIDKPSVVGFLGPNGAGKTTTMRIITGFLAPTDGKVVIDGENVDANNFALHSKIGYLPESNPLYTELEVHEYLKFTGQLSGLSAKRTRERLGYVAERCGLKEVLYEPIYRLSKGYKQRVGLAQAIIHDPKILILDEPSSGLDPNQVIGIRQLISELATEKFVVLSTHILSEVQALCSRVLIINKGKLVLDATSDELQHSGMGNVVVAIKAPADAVAVANIFQSALQPRKVTVSHGKDSISLQLVVEDNNNVREKIFDLCVANGFKMLGLSSSGSDLEKVFRELTLGSDETGQQ
ncbi:MAG: ATP-binding cassette domain-containing protein [Bacteroidetes bacterium]|nr:ATP-binding cassette domain-containing protein [Bacteroidota bacterium]